jgi:hypothetical protein
MPKKKGFTTSQKVILIILSVCVILVCGGMALFAYLNSADLIATGIITRNDQFSFPTEAAVPVAPANPELNAGEVLTDTATSPVPTPTKTPAPTATYVVAPEFINRDKIASIVDFVQENRQLPLSQPIPIKYLTRQAYIEQYQASSFDKDTIDAIKTEQQFYTALGLIEPGVDLMQASIDSQNDILLGFYTPKEKILYIIAESVNMFSQEEMTMAHEYTHAVQDDNFDIGALLANASNGDAQLAARSLPEGDASLIEDLYSYGHISKEEINYNLYHYLFKEHPELKGVSPALGIFTYFPYTAGEYFAVYLLMEGNLTWDKLNAAYKNPPISTEQVLHPEKYLAGEKPILVIMPDLASALGGNWKEIDHNVLGEAGFLVWLCDKAEEQAAFDGATGWDGDSYSLLSDEADHHLLAESSIWESEVESRQFFETFSSYMDLKKGSETRQPEVNGMRTWQYADGVTTLRLSGRKVLIVIGSDSGLVQQANSAFTDF